MTGRPLDVLISLIDHMRCCYLFQLQSFRSMVLICSRTLLRLCTDINMHEQTSVEIYKYT